MIAEPAATRRHGPTAAARIAALDWTRIRAELDEFGCARTGPVLDAGECAGLSTGYAHDAAFRSRVVMARHGYGRGEYRYFAYPLPEIVASLRTALYPRLAPIANHWAGLLGDDASYPVDLGVFLERCHGAGQSRPTPLILKYGPGDYNRLHQGPLRRARLPAPGHLPALPAEPRFQRRRARADRAFPAPAIAGGGRAAGAWRGRHFRGQSPPSPRRARLAPRRHAARGQPAALGQPLHARAHLP